MNRDRDQIPHLEARRSETSLRDVAQTTVHSTSHLTTDDRLKQARKAAVIAIIVSLSITALVGIFAVVLGVFDDLTGRVMLTTMLVGVVSVLTLCVLAGIGRAARWILLTGLVAAALCLIAGVVSIWTLWSGTTSTGVLHVLGVAVTVLVSTAHATLLLLLARRRHPFVRISLRITLGLIVLLCLLIVALIVSDGQVGSDGYGRFLATVAILDVLGTIIVPVVAPFLRDNIAETAMLPGRVGSGTPARAGLPHPLGSLIMPVTAPGPNGTTPFTIAVPDEVLDDLRQRLVHARFITDTGSAHESGTRVDEVRRLAQYWLEGFDWHEEEQWLNSIPQHLATVDFQTVHYVRVPGRGVPGGLAPLPLLLCHGTPDTFVQLLDVAGLLADPAAYGGSAADAFDVIVPSLPGSGFSSAPTGGAPVAENAARILHSVMATRLGYAHYGVYGEGSGAVVGELLAARYPQAVVGSLVSRPPLARQETDTTEALAIALADSPAGLLAWLLDRFGVDEDSSENRPSDDDLLVAAMLHWTSASPVGQSERADPTLLNPGSATPSSVERVMDQPGLSARRNPHEVAEAVRAYFAR